jgi:cytoskeletal protein RodZ
MALFRKKQQTTTNIPELQEYYATQQKESTGKAWLLAIGSLLVTIVILVGLFFGGRWLYRKVTKNDKPAATSQNGSAGSTIANKDSDKKNTAPSKDNGAVPTPTPATTPAQGVSPAQSEATNKSAAAASTTRLADTGPGDTIAVFATVFIVSYVLHRRHTLRKINN